MPQDPIDLSGGLVPKDESIDLSGGLVPAPQGPDLDAQLHQAYDQRPLWRKVLGFEPDPASMSQDLQTHLANKKQAALQSQLTSQGEQIRQHVAAMGTALKTGVGMLPFMALGPLGGMVSEAVGGGGLGLAANVATQGLGSAAVAKAEGGSTPNAMIAGGLGAAGPLVEATAPAMAETALGTRRLERAYGKTPGQAAIAETTGIRPETVAASADQRIQDLNAQLTTAARAAPGMGSTQPAIDAIDNAINVATKRNNYAAMGPLQQLRQQLTEHVVTGQQLPTNMNAEGILETKRGVGALINSWNPEIKSQYTGIKKQIYSALDNELDNLVPESQSLNQRISSLIPVRDRARAAVLAPGLVQSTAQRVAARTGALFAGGLGATEGYKAGGIPGAIVGGAAGIVGPEILASPEFRMFMARSMANPVLREAVTRGGPAALVQLWQQQQQTGPPSSVP